MPSQWMFLERPQPPPLLKKNWVLEQKTMLVKYWYFIIVLVHAHTHRAHMHMQIHTHTHMQ